jgi:AraC-like DNA-binding protein
MESHHRSFGPVDFVVLTLDEQDVADAAFEITGRTLTVAPGTLLRPPPELDAQLMAVIGSAIHSAQRTPAVFSASMAVKALELDLLRLMIACCSHGEALRETVWRRERAAVAKRFEAAVEANGHQPMLVSDLCRSIGVTQRTLSNVCREQLSLSPQKYLTLRRLHMSREALLRLDRHSATVTQIATDFGFWELGRFSANYKAMFGELPSETLRRSSSPARK